MQNMYDALWLSFATISTVGYGDIYPQTSLGKGFAMLAALAGTIYLAMPLAIIGTRFYDVYEEYNKFVTRRTAHLHLQNRCWVLHEINHLTMPLPGFRRCVLQKPNSSTQLGL